MLLMLYFQLAHSAAVINKAVVGVMSTANISDCLGDQLTQVDPPETSDQTAVKCRVLPLRSSHEPSRYVCLCRFCAKVPLRAAKLVDMQILIIQTFCAWGLVHYLCPQLCTHQFFRVSR